MTNQTNQIEVFKNADFGSIRGMQINGEPWFVGKDIAERLGYSNTKDALARHVDIEDKRKGDGVVIRDLMGREQQPVIINESGLYSLVLSSKLPSAKAFKRWVTSEVIPSIRRSGGYIKDKENLSDADLMARALMVAKRQIEQRDQQLKEAAPKVLFADSVSASKTSILVGDLAKLICQNGVSIGQKRLFQWMRDNGYLIKQIGSSQNMPTQKSMERGLFEVKETVITHSDGHIGINKTVKVTGKGQVFFVNKFLAGGKETTT